ncbi:MAG: OpgC domain-containing protein [Pseudomonadota bacterium]
MAQPALPRAPRDVRLDFFRGLAMFIIFVVHVPGGNFWALYIPAAFGHSSAVEMFVFCSGFASAMAFGAVYQTHGFFVGTGRVVFRMWQVYWAHIGLFLTISVLCALGTEYLNTKNYIQQLNLTYFFENLDVALPALMSLRYVPNLFDILPMYIALLAVIPLVMAAYRIHPWAAFALVLALHASAWLVDANFSAHPEKDIVWFFNPFGWSLCFFAGFFFGRGWLKPPKFGDWRLLLICAVILIVSLPLRQWQLFRIDPEDFLLLQPFLFLFTPEWKEVFFPDRWRSDHHWLRLLHFLALAYVCLSLLEGRRHWLESVFVKPIVKVGQQALATFLLSLSLGWAAGMAMDVIGRDWMTVSLVNLSCFGIMIAVAYTTGWFKSQPWRRKVEPKSDRPAQAPKDHPAAAPRPAPAE